MKRSHALGYGVCALMLSAWFAFLVESTSYRVPYALSFPADTFIVPHEGWITGVSTPDDTVVCIETNDSVFTSRPLPPHTGFFVRSGEQISIRWRGDGDARMTFAPKAVGQRMDSVRLRERPSCE